MKKFFMLSLLLVMGIGSFAFHALNIDEKLVRSFQSSFPHAKEVSWYELPRMYMVYFIDGGIRTRIYYNKDGSTAQFIRYYQEEHLPLSIRYQVKKQYPATTVFGVTEIATLSPSGNSHVVYNIKLEDGKYWTTVRTDDEGRFRVVEKFRKL